MVTDKVVDVEFHCSSWMRNLRRSAPHGQRCWMGTKMRIQRASRLKTEFIPLQGHMERGSSGAGNDVAWPKLVC